MDVRTNQMNTLTLESTKGAPFPIDMLRYDTCWPRTGADVAIIVTANAGYAQRGQKVTVARDRSGEWALARWASFGWRRTDAA